MVYFIRMFYNVYLFVNSFSKNKLSILTLFLINQFYNCYARLLVFGVFTGKQSILPVFLHYQIYDYYNHLIVTGISKNILHLFLNYNYFANFIIIGVIRSMLSISSMFLNYKYYNYYYNYNAHLTVANILGNMALSIPLFLNNDPFIINYSHLIFYE